MIARAHRSFLGVIAVAVSVFACGKTDVGGRIGGTAGAAVGNGGSLSTGGSAGASGSIVVGAGGSAASDCNSKRDDYYAAVGSAERCDPAAAEPCVAYDGVECPTVGVSPDQVAALRTALATYKATGCTFPTHSCPIFVMTPPPYTCQAGADGVYKCYSVCEQMLGGTATCVNQSDCPMVLRGFCSGTDTVCCSPN